MKIVEVQCRSGLEYREGERGNNRGIRKKGDSGVACQGKQDRKLFWSRKRTNKGGHCVLTLTNKQTDSWAREKKIVASIVN